MKNFYLLTLFGMSLGLAQIQPTLPEEMSESLTTKVALTENSILKNILLKNIGPTVMSGRVADLEVNPQDPTEFYVGYASGGVWHTKNNGTSFTPIMDNTKLSMLVILVFIGHQEPYMLGQERIFHLVLLILG